MNPSRLRDACEPWLDYVSEEQVLELEQEHYIHDSSSKGETTRWYSFPDEPLQWLQWCLNSHNECTYWREQASDRAFLPDRLVDVGGLGSNSRPRLIYIKEESITDKRYVALSHRWPEKSNPVLEHIQTNADSLRSRREGIRRKVIKNSEICV
jgi:hypothetical protein